MKTIIHNPAHIYPTTGDFIHALEVQRPERILYVSGTMGLDEKGMAGATLERQLELVWDNIRAILADAGMSVDNIVRVTSYLRSTDYAQVNAKARVAALKGRLVPTTAIVVQTLVSDWLIELEIVAVA